MKDNTPLPNDETDDETGTPAANDEAPADGDTPRRRRIPGWLIFFGVLVVLYTIPAVFTAHPRACATCHSMEPFYESWAASRHRAAASECLHCHAKPGAFNRAIYRATIYKDILVVLSGGRITLFRTSAVVDEACTQSGCHSLNRLHSLSGAVKINHALHAEEAPCVKCHLGAGHDDVEGRSSNPPMDLCAECHADVMEECTYCHTDRFLMKRQSSWLHAHDGHPDSDS